MSFSSEEHIEEILWNAHQEGIVENLRKEVDDYIKNKWMNQSIYLILLFSMVLQIIFLFLFLLDI